MVSTESFRVISAHPRAGYWFRPVHTFSKVATPLRPHACFLDSFERLKCANITHHIAKLQSTMCNIIQVYGACTIQCTSYNAESSHVKNCRSHMTPSLSRARVLQDGHVDSSRRDGTFLRRVESPARQTPGCTRNARRACHQRNR